MAELDVQAAIAAFSEDTSGMSSEETQAHIAALTKHFIDKAHPVTPKCEEPAAVAAELLELDDAKISPAFRFIVVD